MKPVARGLRGARYQRASEQRAGAPQGQTCREGRTIALMGSGCSDRGWALWLRTGRSAMRRHSEASNITLERAEGSLALAPAAHRDVSQQDHGLRANHREMVD